MCGWYNTYDGDLELLVVLHGENITAATLAEIAILKHLSLQVKHLYGNRPHPPVIVRLSAAL